MSDEFPVYCERNGETFIRRQDVTLNKDLQELLEGWRIGLEWAQEHEEVCNNGSMRVTAKMIQQLEEVVEE